ncbi:MAG: phage tail protein, partial [Pyrinomonadaceae bacterium]
MAEPFLSEIRIFSFNFAPKSWALCNGQLLPINQNQALFSLLGTTYGGNGQTTFALPDLRGQVPTHIGGGNVLGAKGGTSSVTITQSTMPQHLHFGQGTSNSSGNVATPGNALLAASNVT